VDQAGLTVAPHNPYDAPGTNLQQDENLPVRPITGIVAGVLIDLGGTIVAVTLISLLYAVVIASQGATAAEVESALAHPDPTSPLGLAQGVAGLGMSYLAGFYCVRISRGTNLRYALFLALIVMAVGLGVDLAWGEANVILLLGLSALTVGATLVGGASALRK
jgi:hypothetical protein